MEHYPDIQRHQGTLFFKCPESDRAAISISIERLIDLLDAMDENPDDEDGGDLEPTYGWPNAGQPVREAMCLDDDRELDAADYEPSLGAWERHLHPWSSPSDGSQAGWANGVSDDREDDGDDLEPDNDAEYSYGWTDHIDQSLAGATNPTGTDGEGEPSLGFVGIATGWREGEDRQDSEACQLGDNELEWDFAESGVADFDALEDLEHCSFLTPAEAGLVYDGTGATIAAELVRRAKPRREPYSEIIGTRHHFLQDGSVFTTLVPR